MFDDYFGANPTAVYKGQLIHRFDTLDANEHKEIKVVIESTNSDWSQGVMLKTPGFFEVEGRVIDKLVTMWGSAVEGPLEWELKIVQSKTGRVLVKNVWDSGNGVVDSWHNGHAMIIEDIANGRRYRCNDGHPDDDFDDIIFRIEF